MNKHPNMRERNLGSAGMLDHIDLIARPHAGGERTVEPGKRRVTTRIMENGSILFSMKPRDWGETQDRPRSLTEAGRSTFFLWSLLECWRRQQSVQMRMWKMMLRHAV